MAETKIGLQQALKILQAVGVPVAGIEPDDSADFNFDDALTAAHTHVRGVIEPQIIADHADTNQKAVDGRIKGSLISLLVRNAGADRKALEGLKTQEEIVAAALKTYDSKFSQDTEALRTEMQLMADTHTQALDALKNTHKQEISTARNKFISRDVEEILQRELKDYAFPDKSDRVLLTKDFKRYLEDVAHIHYDENGNAIELRNKDNTELPLYNEAKNQKRTIMEVAKEYFEPRIPPVTDMRNVNPQDAMNKMNNNKPVPVNTNATGLTHPVDQKNSELLQWAGGGQ